MTRHQLDARRLLCPLPVIRVQDRVATLRVGDVLDAVCTDPGAANDVPAWCRMHGHRVLNIQTLDHEIVITIEVGGD